jgi:predicted nucleic acid-binding protein
VTDALFDTTFFIDLPCGEPAAESIWETVKRGNMTGAYSAITVFELWMARGISRMEEVFYESAFELLEIVELSLKAAVTAAVWVRGFRTPVPEAISRDAMIAASAFERGEPIYTRNVRDMQRFIPKVVPY